MAGNKKVFGRPFVKGHKRGGRPKGTKNHTWLNIEYWYNRLNADWFNLTAAQRAKISVELMKALVNKAPSLPQDPNESLQNANASMELIKALESKDKPLEIESKEHTEENSEKPDSIVVPLQGQQTDSGVFVSPATENEAKS